MLCGLKWLWRSVYSVRTVYIICLTYITRALRKWSRKALPAPPGFQQNSWFHGRARWQALAECLPFCSQVGVAFVLFVEGSPLPPLEGAPSFLCSWLTTGIYWSWYTLVPSFLSQVLSNTFCSSLWPFNLPRVGEDALWVYNGKYNITPPLGDPIVSLALRVFQKQQGEKSPLDGTQSTQVRHTAECLNQSEWMSGNEYVKESRFTWILVSMAGRFPALVRNCVCH